MKHISILLLKNGVLSSIDSSKQIFTRVNDFLIYQSKQPFFKIELVGLTRNVTIDNNYSIRCNKVVTEIKHTDLIIIPMVCGDYFMINEKNKEFIPWIKRQYYKNAEIASLCVGSFFLATTGLLNGKSCSVHWAAQNDFRKMFPAVKIVPDKIITYQSGIYTSGGSFSYLNLLLCLIEKFTGREMSLLASKMFEIEFERKRQAPFVIFQGQKDHSDQQVKTAQEFIENNFSEKITIEDLCKLVSVSRRNFERRFKKATANTISEYVQRVRIESVKKGLERQSTTISNLMLEAGYSDMKAFRNIFKKITGLAPVDYKKKYGIKKVSEHSEYELV